MAKVKIQGHASGTGILTVTAPNTSTDRTITLPDATGTLATTADTTDLDGAITINESGADVDFRVESNDDANALFVDGGVNSVGIGTGTPEAHQSTWSSLQVGGNVILQGLSSANAAGEMELGYNVYRHTDGENRHISTGNGSKIYQSNGAINFYVSNGSQNADTSYTMLNALAIQNDGRGLSQFTAKAWIQINHSGNSITDSHNISGFTDVGEGDLLISFDVDMANNDYAAVTNSSYRDTSGRVSVVNGHTYTTGSVKFRSEEFNDSSDAWYHWDLTELCVVVFGD